jgi:hypothetical protein
LAAPGSSSADASPCTTRRRQTALAIAATVALLLPFAGKAVHIDDPLFLWAARQIQADPLRPYDFTVNWYGTAAPMSEVTKNPPLASYYIALVAGLLGWSERVLHLAFLLPAAAVVAGTLLLARRCCARPPWAAALTLASPLFLVCASTLMCDTLMLAFWIGALLCWIAGIDGRRAGLLAAGALLIAPH